MTSVLPIEHKAVPSFPRKSYSRIPDVLEVPNLVRVQTDSFRWFQDEGLKELFQEISPIQDFMGTRFELHLVGGNIVRSSNVTASAKAIRQSIDAPDITEEKERSIEEKTIELLKSVSTPNISDAMHRKGAMKSIHSICLGAKAVGKSELFIVSIKVGILLLFAIAGISYSKS